MVSPEGPIKDLKLFIANSKHIKHQEIHIQNAVVKCDFFQSNTEKHRLFGPGEVGEVLGFGFQIEGVCFFLYDSNNA